MPVLGKLLGVECVRCREAGHRCQAQIVIDEIALCLRCADDEPCIYVTAAEPKPVEEDFDPCIIPALSREDRRALREFAPLPSIHATHGAGIEYRLDAETRAEIMRLSKTMSTDQLAHKFGVPKGTIRNVRHEYRRKQRLRARLYTAVEQQIGDETVWIAPAAVQGAEMLKARYDESEKIFEIVPPNTIVS